MAMQIFNAVVDSIRNTPRPRPVRKHSERDDQRGERGKPQRDSKEPRDRRPETGSKPGDGETGGIDELV